MPGAPRIRSRRGRQISYARRLTHNTPPSWRRRRGRRFRKLASNARAARAYTARSIALRASSAASAASEYSSFPEHLCSATARQRPAAGASRVSLRARAALRSIAR